MQRDVALGHLYRLWVRFFLSDVGRGAVSGGVVVSLP